MPDSLLIANGAPPTKATKYAPVTVKRMFSGLFTNRSPFNSPGDGANTRYYDKFLGGRPDALIDGLNTEIDCTNTLIRRPGFTLFSSATLNATSFYSFRKLDSTITTVADTANAVVNLTATTAYPIMVKTVTTRTYAKNVGNQLFLSDGAELKKYDGNKNLIACSGITSTLTIPWTWTGTGAAAGNHWGQSDIITVVPGQSYTISATIDASHVTSGSPMISIWSPTLSSNYAQATQTAGSNSRVSATWTAPGGVTQVRVLAHTNNCTIANATLLTITNPQLEFGSVVSSYQAPSVGGPLTGIGILAPVSAPTLSFSAGSTNVTAGWGYVSAYKNSNTKHVSTASPISANTGTQTAQSIGVSGTGSSDPQVDTVQIYRTTDGGATYLLLTELPNTSTWSYTDTNADSALNPFITAAIADANDPPPTGLINLTYHAGRMWGSVGNIVYYSAGPDVTVGNGNESWPPANTFTFDCQVVRLVPYSNGLMVFGADTTYAINGTVSAIGALLGAGTLFYSRIVQDGLGLLNYNALDVLGSDIFLVTSDRQFVNINPSVGVTEIGFPIADLIEALDPTQVYVVAHISGHRDKAVYLSDGSTNMYRCAISQPPEGSPCWSPKAVPVGGCGAIASIEVSPGVKRLLMANGTNVLYRDLTSSSDNGTAYPAWATFGSWVLAQPGQLAEIAFITTECVAVGLTPTIAVLMDEISGQFEQLLNSVNDPPDLVPSTTVFANRFYLDQAELPTVSRHMQVKIDFQTQSVANRLLSLSAYGSVGAE